ncbi:hypothetical protein, partial [Escherichia coli]|uniref:hypothetical protein n=1 Tax=Escherichia coli TaxID=562 RepID=UPI00227F9DF6
MRQFVLKVLRGVADKLGKETAAALSLPRHGDSTDDNQSDLGSAGTLFCPLCLRQIAALLAAMPALV